MLAYSRHRQSQTLSGMGEATILVVCRGVQEHDRYREALGAAGLGQRVWFATLTEIEGEGAQAIWSSPKGDGRHSLRTVGTLLYGKEDLGKEAAHMTQS